MISPFGKQALDYAQRGWRVFPLHGIHAGRCTCGRRGCSSPGKHPLTRHGLHDATTDLKAIERWWRQWRRANIGVATGADSGIAVIDIDLPAAVASLGRLIQASLPRTLASLTGGGGIHLFYLTEDESLGNSAGRLPGIERELRGIDLRANGGYIVAPPSVHQSGCRYEWLDIDRSIAPAPPWLKQPERTDIPVDVMKPIDFESDGTPYGLAVLHAELDRLRAAQVGTRNHQLNRSAFALAQLVAGGELLETATRASLLTTARTIGLSKPESSQTIDSAFDAGQRQPRCAPHRLQ